MSDELIKTYRCWGIVALVSAGAAIAGSFIAKSVIDKNF
jgi:hypothetical protein